MHASHACIVELNNVYGLHFSMQLKKIKLTGFKSFVEPTTIYIRSKLMGVVGPNGCGKSNIIDAVRWVLGENSAQTLRGELMTDVIFNGSVSRKPVGQASIDLLFDNTNGKLGGEYASYAEIAIRREITRDGQSTYFFNGTKCRKRDIVDVFLGTGLGPRSYSIIGQGMISRVIDAKPDDLRAFLEEAAGISFYKKRRHKSIMCMRHTRGNLVRLTDLRQEQGKLLERLKQQSKAAYCFQKYNKEKQKVDIQLLGIRYGNYQVQRHTYEKQIQSLVIKYEVKSRSKLIIDAKLKNLNVCRAEQTDMLNAIQSEFYDLGTQIVSDKQTLQQCKERKKQLQIDLEEAKQHAQESLTHLTEDKSNFAIMQKNLDVLTPTYEKTIEKLEKTEALFLDCETKIRVVDEGSSVIQTEFLRSQKDAVVEKTKIEQFEELIYEGKIRLNRLLQEKSTLKTIEHEFTLTLLDNELCELEVQVKLQNESLKKITEILQYWNQIQKIKLNKANVLRAQLQTVKGRQVSLEVLQQAKLWKSNSRTATWISEQHLTNQTRLVEHLQVVSGWEHAVETVLSDYLEAICVENLVEITGALKTASQVKLTFIEMQYSKDTLASGRKIFNKETLLSKVSTRLSIAQFLQKIYIAVDLTEALEYQVKLQEGESIVTRSGIWVGVHWIRISQIQDAYPGVFQREKELTIIQSELKVFEFELTMIEYELKQIEEQVIVAEEDRYELQEIDKVHEQRLSEKVNEVRVAKMLYKHMQYLVKCEKKRIEEGQIKVIELEKTVVQCRMAYEIAIETMSKFAKQRDSLFARKNILQQQLRIINGNVRNARNKAYKLEIKQQTLIAHQQAMSNGLQRLEKQLFKLQARRGALKVSLSKDEMPMETKMLELDKLLKKRVVVDDNLKKVRAKVGELDNTICNYEKERVDLDQILQDIQIKLDKLRLEYQAVKVRSETIIEALEKYESRNIEDVVNSLPKNVNERELNQCLIHLTSKIDQLGVINLSSIDEHNVEFERQQYLELQQADLEDALRTIENAIRKIDKETRAKFKCAFYKVNENFQQLFPKLFGGGRAYLELVGKDSLEAGVSVMVQLPGKRNSTIHRLSGGEKALTAVSLVFAIFQLNPAPFCMLDEVDAQLDDNNVIRFCRLLQSMSEFVQFIFITHNTITMEIANQLAGVTMNEPGISRLVTVDIDEAANMVIA